MRSSRLFSCFCTVLMLSSITIGGMATVSAQQQGVNISVDSSTEEPVVGESVTFNVTVTNQAGSDGVVDVSSVMLRTGQEHYERVEDVGSLAPGGSLTVQMTTSFESVGQKDLTAHVSAEQAAGGNLRAYYSPVTVDVQEVDINGGLSTSTNESDETTVSFTNYGNVELSDVKIAAATDDEIRDRRDVFDVAPDETNSVAFDTSGYATDDVTFTATYTARGDQHETTRTVDLDQEVSGEIRLTGIDLTRGGSVITIDGEAANVGGTDVESVLVRIPDTDKTSPASGSGEFFVGSVDASEFATFELTATVEGDTVPIEIEYITDNDRVTTTQTIDVSSTNVTSATEQNQPQATSAENGQNQTGLPLIPIIIGLLVTVGLGGTGLYLWNRE